MTAREIKAKYFASSAAFRSWLEANHGSRRDERQPRFTFGARTKQRGFDRRRDDEAERRRARVQSEIRGCFSDSASACYMYGLTPSAYLGTPLLRMTNRTRSAFGATSPAS